MIHAGPDNRCRCLFRRTGRRDHAKGSRINLILALAAFGIDFVEVTTPGSILRCRPLSLAIMLPEMTGVSSVHRPRSTANGDRDLVWRGHSQFPMCRRLENLRLVPAIGFFNGMRLRHVLVIGRANSQALRKSFASITSAAGWLRNDNATRRQCRGHVTCVRAPHVYSTCEGTSRRPCDTKSTRRRQTA
jgi:hypothetical protein